MLFVPQRAGQADVSPGFRSIHPRGLKRGSDAGPVIVAGRPAESKLIQAVSGRLAVKMPPTGKLSDEQIATLCDGWRWAPRCRTKRAARLPGVRSGAPPPRTLGLAARQRGRASGRARCALAACSPPTNSCWPRWSAKDSRRRAPADRRTLLRRLSFDLTGLPPSPDEVRAFEADRSPDAYEKQVDRLLASSRFGEHWARHWMDLVRYCESHGSEGDPDTPHGLALSRLPDPRVQ